MHHIYVGICPTRINYAWYYFPRQVFLEKPYKQSTVSNSIN